MFDIGRMLVMVPPFLFAITVHEYAHAWMALRKGDPTARDAGRLTLNPIYHLDVFGTLMLFVVGFGWAKPVPVNPHNLRDPLKDQIWISAAGPASNLILAFFFGLVIRIFGLASIPYAHQLSTGVVLAQMMIFAMQINIILAVFNMLPLPPLDGSHILRGVLPRELLESYYKVERYGPMVLMGIIMLGFVTGVHVFGMFFSPFLTFFSYLFAGI